MTGIRVFLAEDHATVREALRLLVGAEPDLTVVGEAASGAEALARVTPSGCDVLVLDLTMPDMNGLAVTRSLRAAGPAPAIVVLTRHDDHAYVRELLAAGVDGYVLKQSPSASLLAAIRAAARREPYLDPELRVARSPRTAHRPRGGLTEREAQVLKQAANGAANKDIATALNISVKTVEVHKSNAMRKLGLHDRADVIRFALLRGWLEA